MYVKTTWVTGTTPLSASNMNHIEKGIADAHDLIAAVSTVFYPVGCYFETSDAEFDPNEVFGGVWLLEREGQVHVSGSADGSYQVSGALTNTSDGGSADASVVQHTHGYSGTTAATNEHAHSFSFTVGGGGHEHTYDHSIRWTFTESGANNEHGCHEGFYAATTGGGGGHSHSGSGTTGKQAAHSHTLSGTTASTGESATGKNMMPHIIVYRWHRTA